MREFWDFSEVSYEAHMLVSLTIYILARGEMTTRNKKKYKKKPLKNSCVSGFSGVSYERTYLTLIFIQSTFQYNNRKYWYNDDAIKCRNSSRALSLTSSGVNQSS